MVGNTSGGSNTTEVYTVILLTRVGRDQFFGTRPRPRNKTYQNSLRDRDREKVDADFLNETRPRRDCLIFLCPRRDRDET